MSYPDTKSCTKCGVEKDRSEFGKKTKRRDGLQSWCKNCLNADRAAYRKANREKVKARNAAYYEANRERVLAQYAEYREANRETLRTKARSYQKANPVKRLARNAKYRATKLQATPKWLNDRDFWLIEQFYEWSEYLDGPHHVDHIVPLQGEDVCGLHVPWNLQVLTAKENLKKSNKLEGGVYDQ